MISVDKMLKCRALFLQTIAALYGDSIVFDDDFRHLLQNFYDNYIKEHFSKFALIYCFELKKGRVVIHEEREWAIELDRYLNYFIVGDNKRIIKLYDDIGDDNVNKITELAMLFCNYINEMSQSASLIKS